MKKCSTTTIFWALVGVFIVVLCQFFIPAFRDLFRGSELFLIPMAVLSLLGVVLLILTLKERVEGRLGKFLFLTGASATGFFVAVLLHNVFYALNVVTSQIVFLNYLTKGLHIIFFFIAIPICPIGFLIGMIGSIVLFIKKGRKN